MGEHTFVAALATAVDEARDIIETGDCELTETQLARALRALPLAKLTYQRRQRWAETEDVAALGEVVELGVEYLSTPYLADGDEEREWALAQLGPNGKVAVRDWFGADR